MPLCFRVHPGSAGLALLALYLPAGATPLINEIMFHPAGVPENTAHEYIEIYNPDPAPFSLAGCRIDQGVTFNFPAASVPAGGYLVVAANLAAFQAKYPGVTNVVAGWTGSLSNSAEGIRIVDALGVLVDEVNYATEGDWGRRVREPQWSGWDWDSTADGGGRSLELINPLLGNNNGQNWGPGNANDGTPGQANSIRSADTAPLIKDVKHRPAVPQSSDPIRISCEIEDENPAGDSVTLFWRVSAGSPPPFSPAPMALEADGRYAAVLQPHAEGTIIEFYIQSSDGLRTRTWPAPTSEGQNANALLQVSDELAPEGQVMLRMVLSVEENDAYDAAGGGNDREYNVSLVANIGNGDDVYYRSGMRTRGASSRNHNPRPMRMSVPNDNKIGGAAVFNLNPRYSYLQYVGYKLFQAAGLRAPDARPANVRRNGENTIRNDEYDYGRWAMVEHLDADFVDNHWPLDSAGNLYKKVRPDNSWAYRNGNAAAYVSDGFTKETNSSANNWGDLDNLMGVMNANPSGPDYLSDIQFAADVPQWMKWFALQTLIANGETSPSNGADDDYSMYRGIVNARFQFVPHDLDTILGYGDGSVITDPNHTLFDMTTQGDVLEPLVPFFQIPSIRQSYFTALRDLAATLFTASRFDPFIDNHLGLWVSPDRIAGMKSFIAARRTFVLNSVVPEVGAYVPPVPTTTNSLSDPRSGPLAINEVLARNDSIHSHDGLFPDVIELRNYGATPVDLGGRSLTDTPDVKDKFVFPGGTTIPGGSYLILYAGAAPAGGTGIYVGFGINQQGDDIYLYDSVANGQGLIDAIAFGPQAPNYSIGRTGLSGDTWRLGSPTIGAANSTQTTGDVAQLKINEWLTNPDFKVTDDFVELYNPLSTPVALGGLIVTDDIASYPTRYALPPLSFIGPQGFTTLFPKGNDASPANPSELPFKFSALSTWIFIRGSNSATIDFADVDAQFRDATRGRSPDGAVTLIDFPFPTPGLPNASVPPILQSLMDSLRITEINYNPQGGNQFEFVELRNIGAASIDLGGVRFTNGIDFTFPAGTLAPGAYAVVVRDLAAFESRYGTGRPVRGVYSGALDNSGETLALTLPNPWDVNILSFRFERDWYPSTNGGGFTLEIVNAFEVEPRDWDDPDSWVAGSALHGTPGMPSPPVIVSPLAAGGTVASSFGYAIAATNSPTSFSAASLPTGLSVNPSTGQISGTPTASGTFNVTLGATNVSGTGNATLVLTIVPQPPPVITSPLIAGGVVNSLFSYQIAATSNPTSFTAVNRPAWLNFNSATGLLSGTPTAAGNFNVGIGATNAAGSDTKNLQIQIVSDLIAAAVDSGQTFQRGGNANWFSQTTRTHDGVDAAQSGPIGDSQSTWVQTTINGPRRLTFWWSVSSEEGWDYLRFRIDNTVMAGISGEVNWAQQQFDIPPGSHTLRWAYEKDSIIAAGSDAAWLDQVVVTDPDVDSDGMSDIWETTYFGNLSRNGTGDFDSDGQSDASEFMAGTLPNSGSSRLDVVSVMPQTNDQYEVTWASVDGRNYQVQASPDLSAWINIGPVVPAFGPTTSTVAAVPGSIVQDVTLVAETAPMKALIPTSDVGTLWRGGNESGFNAVGGDSSWISGTSGLGYEASPGDPINYVPYIGTDVSAARFANTSVLARLRFNVANPVGVSSLLLGMRVDDGFVAWINGQRVAGLRDPAVLSWDSAATGNVPDESQAIVFRPFVVTPPFTFLRAGENILAIQALNATADSTDLLAQPRLSGQMTLNFPGNRIFWRVTIAAP